MTLDDYNACCRALPHTSHVVQWGGSHVWKVAGKVFAVAGWNAAHENLFVTFRCSQTSYELLQCLPGLRPAPYLASRGMKWIQRTSSATMSDADLGAYLAESHRIIASGLSRRRQKELGIGQFVSADCAPATKRSPPPNKKPRASRAQGGALT